MLGEARLVRVQPTQATSNIQIRIARAATALRGLHADPGLGAFFRYASTAARRTFSTIEYVQEHGGTAFLACLGDTIVGYLVLARPVEDQPWGGIPDLAIREVSVEISREWRRRGLARRLFAAMLADPDVEHSILVATAYRWCWDLDERDSSPVDGTAYGRRLFALFAAAGFARKVTNEPNIAMDPRNFLAVRVGARVPTDRVRRFEATLFVAGIATREWHENATQGGLT
jgi:GNAT superfamily N-acetyltransferase